METFTWRHGARHQVKEVPKIIVAEESEQNYAMCSLWEERTKNVMNRKGTFGSERKRAHGKPSLDGARLSQVVVALTC